MSLSYVNQNTILIDKEESAFIVLMHFNVRMQLNAFHCCDEAIIILFINMNHVDDKWIIKHKEKLFFARKSIFHSFEYFFQRSCQLPWKLISSLMTMDNISQRKSCLNANLFIIYFNSLFIAPYQLLYWQIWIKFNQIYLQFNQIYLSSIKTFLNFLL